MTWEDHIHFGDPRPPHEVRVHFEKDLVVLFRPELDGGKLVFRAAIGVTGSPYRFELWFHSALPKINCYTLHVDTDWSKLPEAHHDYFRKSAASWFKHWTRDFKAAMLPPPNANSPERYRLLTGQALAAESDLIDVAAVQQAILAGMRKGGTFSTAHKEGGTTISFAGSRSVRADYGESNETETFNDEASFLAFLRKFYDWKTSSAIYPDKVSEFDAWKLIFRLLSASRAR